MTNLPSTTLCNLFINSYNFLPAAIEIGASKTLHIRIPSSLNNLPAIYHAICGQIHHIFPDSTVSNIFLEKLAPTYLKADNPFKAHPLVRTKPMTFMEAVEDFATMNDPMPDPIDPERDYLHTINFDLGVDSILPQKDLVTRIQDAWTSSITPPFYFRPRFPTLTAMILPPLPSASDLLSQSPAPLPKSAPNPFLYSIPPKLYLLIGELPFTIPLTEILSCLGRIISSFALDDIPYQSEPFIYPFTSMGACAAAGAASASTEKPLMSSLTPKTGSIASTISEKEDVTIEKEAKKRDYETLLALQIELQEKFAIDSATPFPLLHLTPEECLSIFTRNIPDIARSMLTGVLESSDPNQASLIRMQLFINLLVQHQEPIYSVRLPHLINAIEKAICGLTDQEKAWARAKFISIAFLNYHFPKFYNPDSNLPLQWNKSGKRTFSMEEGFFSNIDTTALTIQTTNGKIKRLTTAIYEKRLRAVTRQLKPLSIMSTFTTWITFKEDTNWRERKHLLLSRLSHAPSTSL